MSAAPTIHPMRLAAAALAIVALAGCVGPLSRKTRIVAAEVAVDENGYRELRNQPGAYDQEALADTRGAASDQLLALLEQQQRAAQTQQRAQTVRVEQKTPGLVLCGLVQAPPEVQAAVVSLPPLSEVRGKVLVRAPVADGCIVSGFGMADARGRPSGGIDFFGQADVLAAGDGEVAAVGEIPEFGRIVVIDHGDGVRTRYANLGPLQNGVERGARVARGQPIARMGTSGFLPEAGLHFELELDGQRIDPLSPPPPGAG